MLVKTEKFINEQGDEILREYHGKDKNHISAIIESAISQDDTESSQQEESISQDELNAEILLNQSMIIAKQEDQDEVLAEILLNQMEG